MNRPIAVLSLYVPIRCPRALDDFRSGMSPPGMLATRLAGRLVVLSGRDARPSRANVRHPAAAQLLTAQPFVLDGLPRDHGLSATVGGREGTRLRRVLLRWQAPQPYSTHGRRGLPGPLGAGGPYVTPYALGVRIPGFAGRAHRCWSVPLRGEWSGQAEWCASRD
jgi:hypothetical protein